MISIIFGLFLGLAFLVWVALMIGAWILGSKLSASLNAKSAEAIRLKKLKDATDWTKGNPLL